MTDAANRKQLSLVIRYFDPKSKTAAERLLDFTACHLGVTGHANAETILDLLQKNHLDPKLFRGQGYEGASNMAEKVKGAAAIITSKYPFALNFHCASHQLNLAVMKSAKLISVKNLMGTCKKLHDFFYVHPKRQQKLEDAIDKCLPQSKQKKIKDLSPTRWIARLETLDALCYLHPAAVECIEMILNNSASWSAESVADAKSLLSAITLPEFLAALIITNHISSYTANITRSLRSQSRDIVEAISGINVLCDTLQSVRDDVDTRHCRWMDETKKMCEDIGVELCIPRLCGRQQHRDNVPAETPDEYYKRYLTILLLYHVLMEMKSRFSIHQQSATYDLCFVPATMVLMEQAEALHKLTSVENLYKADLPYSESVWSELHC